MGITPLIKGQTLTIGCSLGNTYFGRWIDLLIHFVGSWFWFWFAGADTPLGVIGATGTT